ncbi:ral-GDS-related protein-like isoform X1 [Diceros bicornis minor]|uniref:ral-GDS-related protein-like isoform X1 n=1 Tax=Diceros bicornis minor TaxID=77932 RepID=UPI0026EE327B|nr:ral-GDS-related protein-like isoform X1 [Diceros bicornis minor]
MLIQAVWIFWVFKQKGFTLKPLHSVSFLFSLLRKNWQILKNIIETCHQESRKLLKEEVSSVRATLQMDPQGAQERQQQGVVPFLGMFLYHLKLLDIGMEDDLEVSEPGGGAREQDPEVWEARALHWDLSCQYLANLLS